MGAEHVIAIIAALLQVRNSVVIAAEPSPAKRDIIIESLGDPIQEARELLNHVIADNPQMSGRAEQRKGRSWLMWWLVFRAIAVRCS